MSVWHADSDGDGYGSDAVTSAQCEGPASFLASGGDRDDSDAGVNPDADEYCGGVDEDCDGVVDNDAADPAVWFNIGHASTSSVLDGVVVEYAGAGDGNGVTVYGSGLVVTNSAFQYNGGSGAYMAHNSAGSFSDSSFTGNASHGLEMLHYADLTDVSSDNSLTGNGGCR